MSILLSDYSNRRRRDGMVYSMLPVPLSGFPKVSLRTRLHRPSRRGGVRVFRRTRLQTGKFRIFPDYFVCSKQDADVLRTLANNFLLSCCCRRKGRGTSTGHQHLNCIQEKVKVSGELSVFLPFVRGYCCSSATALLLLLLLAFWRNSPQVNKQVHGADGDETDRNW